MVSKSNGANLGWEVGEKAGKALVTPGRFELPTRSLGNCCSIHLSYGATVITGYHR